MILLTVVAILTKLFGGGLGARLTGFDNHSSAIIGSGMISRGSCVDHCRHRAAKRLVTATVFYFGHYCCHCNYTCNAATIEIYVP